MSKNPKTIILLAPTPPPYGGGEIMSEILINGLKKKSCFNIIHINSSDNRGNSARGNFDLTNIKKGFSDLLVLIKNLIIHKPVILYTTIGPGSYTVFLRDSLYILSAWLFKAKIICHLHSSGFFLQLHRNSPFFRFVLKKIHTLITLGEKIKQNLENHLPVQNIVVIYNGIKPVLQHKPEKNPKDQFNVLFIGNLVERKGFFDLLRAVPIVLKEAPNIYFLFAGEWGSSQDKDYTLNFIRQNKIEENVKFLGLVTGEKKEDFFKKGDILVLPSHREGQPIVLLEAMSAGLPIISTDVGSVAETMNDNKNGFLVPIGDSIAIAEKILLLYHNDALRTSMACISRQIFETKFSDDIFLENIQKLFNHVASLQGL